MVDQPDRQVPLQRSTDEAVDRVVEASELTPSRPDDEQWHIVPDILQRFARSGVCKAKGLLHVGDGCSPLQIEHEATAEHRPPEVGPVALHEEPQCQWHVAGGSPETETGLIDAETGRV